jgi:formylmethanofuran dehydrogenase subunit C
MIRIRSASTVHVPVDFTGVLPEAITGLSVSKVARLPIHVGNRIEEIGAVYSVIQDSSSTAELIFEGDFQNAARIGAGMSSGEIHLKGRFGMHVGAGLRGGSIHLNGTAADWLGAEMSGGEIHVCGEVGDAVGASYRGSRHGMSGGVIRIDGDAGDELGLRMRRGMIIVNGHCRDFAGSAMIAGTIAISGQCGYAPGAGMKRGTILMRTPPTQFGPGFVHAFTGKLSFMAILNSELLKFGWSSPRSDHVRVHRGDLVTGGRGEIIEMA